MPEQGLIFIPDISGFSRFVTRTEIDHSRLIVQELLETLIEANEIGLEVSEIEGDAILFYRYGDAPPLDELYRQVERMFCAFHASLGAYDLRKYCQCDACLAAKDLTLKVITHYGEFTGYTVSSFSKLIGRDVIVAHELLKNDIDDHEYWLVTEGLAGGRPQGPATWLEWMTGAKQTQSGEVPFHYAQLGRLRETVSTEPVSAVKLSQRALMAAATRVYDTDIVTLFHATGDFNHRSRWQEGVAHVEELDHMLPRVGMRCRCTLENGKTLTYTSTYYSWGGDRIEFLESVDEEGGLTRYLLEALDEAHTRLTIEYYVTSGLAAEVVYRLTRKRDTERRIDISMQRLAALAAAIAVEEADRNTPPAGAALPASPA